MKDSSAVCEARDATIRDTVHETNRPLHESSALLDVKDSSCRPEGRDASASIMPVESLVLLESQDVQ